MKTFISTVIVIVLFSGCKPERFYTGDPKPVISKVVLNQSTFKQFTDTVVISFDYVDGDGDLGYDNADSLSLEIKDVRFAKADYYHVRPLAPAGSQINIHGTIKVTLKNVFLLGAGSSETTKFQIRIKDRMQHWSNILETKTISITK
ncbi:MAG: hypothetical protein EBR94_00080 [Bacteroidetes bacterium]|jgi:hypothetical protein|nr:hypothetical protein [Bacteroidota bacterium]